MRRCSPNSSRRELNLLGFPHYWELTELGGGGARYQSFYPDGPEKSDSLSRIVSEGHAARIKGLLERTEGDIICGGQVDVATRYVAPTIVDNVTMDDSLMSE